MFSRRFVRLLISLLFMALLVACQGVESQPAAEYPSEVATNWFDLQLKLIQETPGFTPPVASRALGYSGVALYESIVPGMPKHNSLVGQVNALTALPQPEQGEEYHWAAVANSAMATMLRLLYPTATPENLAAIDALEAQYASRFREEAGEEIAERSAAHGQAVAEAVFEWSKSDGGHEGYASNFPGDFTPPVGEGYWVPTPPNFQSPLQPYWGDKRTFALAVDEECVAPPPPVYSEDMSSDFYAEAIEVYYTVKKLTPEQEEIALFWADDPGKTFTPPGHSISTATIALRQEAADLALAAETYAKVGIAVADAFVGCWHAKYVHNLLRPISFIQEVVDPSWNTPEITDPVTTPPFPEYTSGHSVQSGATAAVLTELFGESYNYVDDAHVERGLPAREFGSFSEAAAEAAISRLYGGIHYRSAIEAGLEQGRCIGAQVNGLSWTK